MAFTGVSFPVSFKGIVIRFRINELLSSIKTAQFVVVAGPNKIDSTLKYIYTV